MSETERRHGERAPKQPLEKLELTRVGLVRGGQSFTGRGRYVNAVIDALAHAGVRNIDMPMTPDKVWEALNEVGLAG